MTQAAQTLHQFLKTKASNRWLFEEDLFHCKQLPLSKPQLLDALAELEALELIERRLSKKSNPCCKCISSSPKKDVSKSILTTDLPLSIEEQLLTLIQSETKLPKNYKTLALRLDTSVEEIKKATNQLISRQLIQTTSAKSIGPCLIPFQETTKQKTLNSTKKSTKNEPLLFLVDTENASNANFYKGLEALTDKDKVILVMSPNSKGFLTPELIHRLFHLKASVETVLTPSSGKNALDFVLIVQTTLKLSKNQKQHIRIVSKDQGYDSAILNLIEELNLKPSQICRVDNFLTS